jgi:hypothetical protein
MTSSTTARQHVDDVATDVHAERQREKRARIAAALTKPLLAQHVKERKVGGGRAFSKHKKIIKRKQITIYLQL